MKKTLNIRIPREVYKTMQELRNQVLKDDDLTYFRMNTHSDNAFVNFIISMGLVKAKQDFVKWKKHIEDEE